MATTMNDERQPNARDLQRLETRRALAEQAIRLFGERGFDQTTVEEIAASAGVSTRTFFLHFPTKAAAAFPDHGERVDDFVQRLNSGDPFVQPLSQLRSVLLARIDTTSPSRLARYALLSRVPELRDEDARTDRDYEEAIAGFLVLHWGSSPEAVVRANAIANAVIGVVRATLSAAGEHGIDARAVTAEILGRLLGVPLDEPLHSVQPNRKPPASPI
jgi:AcrR family transcriptional regulator